MSDARAVVLGMTLVACGFDSGGVASGGTPQSTSESGDASASASDTTATTATTAETSGATTSPTSTTSADGSTSAASGESTSSGSTRGTSTGESGDEPPEFGPFLAPVEVFELNTGASDDDPTLRADLLEIYFASLRDGGEGSEDIWRARRDSREDDFVDIAPVAALNGTSQDGWPELSHDGLVITLASDRGGGEGGFDIYVSVRDDVDDDFPEPVLAADLSTPDNEAAAALSATMLEAFLCSPLAAAAQLHVATRDEPDGLFSAAAPLASVNARGRECTPFIDESGTRLLFGSDRAGTAGATDIWTAVRDADGDTFAGAENVEALNSVQDDDDPWWAPDGSAVYFSSSRGGDGDLDLWVAYRQ